MLLFIVIQAPPTRVCVHKLDEKKNKNVVTFSSEKETTSPLRLPRDV